MASAPTKPKERERLLDWPRSIEAAIRELGAASEVAWLDSSEPGRARGVFAIDPIGILTFQPGEGAKFDSNLGQRRSADAWSLWRALTRELPLEQTCPNWIGYIGYEMARTLERNRVQAGQDSPLPWLRMALFDCAVSLDER